MMKLLFYFVSLLFSAQVFAKDLGTASFVATGEGLALDIEGNGGKVLGEVVKGKSGGIEGGEFDLLLSDFKTGSDLRDKHFCELLDCKKFPMSHFILSPFDMKDGPVIGSLRLHGIEKKVKWNAKVSGSKVLIEGEIKLSDYGMKAPNYKLAKVSDSVGLKIEIAVP